MTATGDWKAAGGAETVRVEDIPELNQVFSEAFTERYRRDGLVGVRVPHLNPAIWRYAIADAADGAMLWRGEQGEIVAFNIAHRSGREGWMGPLAVRNQSQGKGLGKRIVRAGIDWLRENGATVVGLETMPRTMDNIGFYSGLGFVPLRMTLTVTLEAAGTTDSSSLLGKLHSAAREDIVKECARLTSACAPGVDFTREIELTAELGLGDTALYWRDGRLGGYALFHTAPLVEGRSREELRVLKMVLAREKDLTAMASLLLAAARRTATRRIAIRVQGEYVAAYRALLQMGGRVRWTDLRMALCEEEGGDLPSARGLVLSNWEI